MLSPVIFNMVDGLFDMLRSRQRTIQETFNIADLYFGADQASIAEEEGEEFRMLINTHLEGDFYDFTQHLFEESLDHEVPDP